MPFNERMLTMAKESAGLTQAAIAQHAGVSQSLLSKIENGFEPPSDDFLTKAAEITGVPVEFFQQEDAVLPQTLFDIYHKKRLTLPAKPLKKANSNAQMIRLEIERLLRSFEVPAALPFPNLPLGEHESPAEVAMLTRSMWRTPSGPLSNLVEAVEATGTPVVAIDLGHEKLRALSMPGVHGSNAHIIVLNSGLPASAQRFALAHEVGHLVMHEGVATDAMERESDDFASALLMPAADIAKHLRNVRFRDLGQLKAIWRVSLAALIYRAYSLHLITERHYRTLNMDLNRLPNGRKREPGEFKPEQPTLIQRVIEAYRNQYEYSITDLCRLMVVTETTFRQRYFDESEAHQPPRFRLIQNS